jgi:uncharacterized protein YneF (UPF0154 family)
MKILLVLLAISLFLGIGLIIGLYVDFCRAKNGKKSIFWEEDDD